MKYRPAGQKVKKSPRKVISAGGEEYTVAKEKPKRQEEIHVLRPLVKLLYDIEAKTKALSFFHIPNELLRRSVMKKIFYHLGVRSGVPDLVLLLRGGVVIFIELKYGKPGKGENGLSEGQEGFIALLKRLGFPVYIICAQDARESCRQLYEILAAHGLKI